MNRLMSLFGALFEGLDRFRALCVRHYLVSRLGSAGAGVVIGDHVRLYAPEHIRAGDGVVIANHVILRAMTCYPWTNPPQTFKPEIVLERGCFINNYSQISCARRVVIGADVMIAERCFIADNNHTYDDPAMSIKAQPLTVAGEVHIGEGSWIGTNAVVAGNVRIGRHCVVGANSVVLDDLPDFSIAVGAPARAVKQYDAASKVWKKV